MTSCVFAREFWFLFLSRVGLRSPTHQPDDCSFDDWWDKSSNVLADHLRKGLNSIIILRAWSLWNLRNRYILYGDSPNLARALLLANEELHF